VAGPLATVQPAWFGVSNPPLRTSSVAHGAGPEDVLLIVDITLLDDDVMELVSELTVALANGIEERLSELVTEGKNVEEEEIS
jgi:hypothetical protein